jgi:hypothetical protein
VDCTAQDVGLQGRGCLDGSGIMASGSRESHLVKACGAGLRFCQILLPLLPHGKDHVPAVPGSVCVRCVRRMHNQRGDEMPRGSLRSVTSERKDPWSMA